MGLQTIILCLLNYIANFAVNYIVLNYGVNVAVDDFLRWQERVSARAYVRVSEVPRQELEWTCCQAPIYS